MDNAQTALIVGLGGVLTTAIAGTVPTIFIFTLEKRRLKQTNEEHQWQQRHAEQQRRLKLADLALDSLGEFLSYSD